MLLETATPLNDTAIHFSPALRRTAGEPHRVLSRDRRLDLLYPRAESAFVGLVGRKICQRIQLLRRQPVGLRKVHEPLRSHPSYRRGSKSREDRHW